MPIIWIGKITAPNKARVNIPFQISWDVWYLGWPFRKIKIFSRITWDCNSYEKEYFVRPWFIGRLKTTAPVPGINKDTIFLISVGWRD